MANDERPELFINATGGPGGGFAFKASRNFSQFELETIDEAYFFNRDQAAELRDWLISVLSLPIRKKE